MRSLLVRLSCTGGLGAALAGCGGSGAALSPTGPADSSGGGVPAIVGRPASGSPAPDSVPPLLLDDGSERAVATPAPGSSPAPGASPATTPAPAVYAGLLNTRASEVQSPLQSPVDAASTGGQAPPPNPSGPFDYGSHRVTFAGGGIPQVVLQFSKVLPDLVYSNLGAVPGSTRAYFTYGTLVFHLGYVPGTRVAPPQLGAVSAEITGANAVAAFDVRVGCGGVPDTTGAFVTVTCAGFPALGAVANTAGPNPVAPSASGPYDPVSTSSPRLSLVLDYLTPIPANSTGNVVAIDNVYASQ